MFKKIPSKDVSKFLGGAFFMSAGGGALLYAVGVSVPFGSFTVTPTINGARSIVHFDRRFLGLAGAAAAGFGNGQDW
jgi:hypothetical protein